MADKITWNDKNHVIPYGTREIQVWDLDMNEIKATVNWNADILENLETNQVTGFIARQTLAEVQALIGDINTAYYVLDDDVSVNNNGVWGFDGAVYYQAYKNVNSGAFDDTDNIVPATQKSTSDFIDLRDYFDWTYTQNQYIAADGLFTVQVSYSTTSKIEVFTGMEIFVSQWFSALAVVVVFNKDDTVSRSFTGDATGDLLSFTILEGESYVISSTLTNKESVFQVSSNNIFRSIVQAGISDEAIIDYVGSKTDGFINLMDGVSYTDGFYLSDGVSTASPTLSYSTLFPVSPNTDYTLFKSGGGHAGGFYDISQVWISEMVVLPTGTKDATVTTPYNCYFISINLAIVDQITAYFGLTSLFNKYYLDDLFIDTNNINNEAVTPLKISENTNENTNLYDGTTWTDGFYVNGDTISVSAPLAYSDYIAVEPNTDYETYRGIPQNGAFYDSNKSYISTISGTTDLYPQPFTTPETCRFVRVNIYIIDKPIATLYNTFKIGKYSLDWLFTKELPDPNRISLATRGLNSFIGAQNFVIDQLLIAKPRARIVIVSHYSRDAYNVSRRYDKLIETQDALIDYWGCYGIKMYHGSQLMNREGNNTITEYMPDNVHPGSDLTLDTVQILADKAVKELSNIFEDFTGKKVAWYGTSIPYGTPNIPQSTYSYANVAIDRLGGTIQNRSVPTSFIRLTKYNGDPVTIPTNSFTNLASTVNYQNNIIDLIGTIDEPDLFVFDFGFNDWGNDRTDFDLFDAKNPY